MEQHVANVLLNSPPAKIRAIILNNAQTLDIVSAPNYIMPVAGDCQDFFLCE